MKFCINKKKLVDGVNVGVVGISGIVVLWVVVDMDRDGSKWI